MRDCLSSILQSVDISYEIIVIDNDSRDGTPEFLRLQPIKSLFPGKNIGYGAAVNLGAKQATGKYILVTNPDTIYTPKILKELFDFAVFHPKAGLISPLLLHPDGRIQISAREFPRRRDLALGRGTLIHKLGISNEKYAGYIQQLGDEPLQVPTVPATAVLIPALLLSELKGFDERFFMYMEDIDLCRRVKESGYQIWILPPVKVRHVWRRSTSKRRYFASWHHHCSVYKYFLKFYPHEYIKNSILFFMLVFGFILNSFAITFMGKKG